jgi:hypothetical protein
MADVTPSSDVGPAAATFTLRLSAVMLAKVTRLRTHNQKMTVAAIAIALMKACAHRS